MTSRISSKKRRSMERAQAIAEFAIVLPILLLVLVGILEVGRMMFYYAAAANASRDAVRYASAVGLNDASTSTKFNDCAGIRLVAKRSAFLVPLQDADISISYDDGPGTASIGNCPITNVISGQRVNVSISVTYRPMVNLIPIGTRTFTSASSRTILGIFQLPFVTPGVPSGPVGSTATFTATATATSTGAATATSTDTPTATSEGQFFTFTPSATNTLPPPATATATDTATATLTSTPTATSTPVTGCDSISHGTIAVPGTGGNKTMSMTITNPNTYAVTIQNIQVSWNSATGGSGNPGSALYLKSASLGSTFWNWTGGGNGAPGPSYTVPASGLTISANSTSTLMFTFDGNYQHASGNSITVNLSTPGCESTPIHNP